MVKIIHEEVAQRNQVSVQTKARAIAADSDVVEAEADADAEAETEVEKIDPAHSSAHCQCETMDPNMEHKHRFLFELISSYDMPLRTWWFTFTFVKNEWNDQKQC
jgi:hypothetical protein